VREVVEEGVSEIMNAQAKLDEVYAAYAEEGADFDKLAAEQQRLENILAASDAHALERQLGSRRRRAAPAALGCQRRQALRW
jgi:ATPase subunit of ABC transporter with duplicated ATPase domains